jgi:AcrR family transcriptional regulator
VPPGTVSGVSHGAAPQEPDLPAGAGRAKLQQKYQGTKLQQKYQLITRRRLLDAALEVFGQQGFNAATVEAIVSAAGAARATFYLHFTNQMEIVHELTEEIRPSVAELYGDLDAALSGPEPVTRAVVEAWLRKALAWYEVPGHRIIAFVWQELPIESGDMVVRGISVDDHLPRYLARWPPPQREAARTRVILLSHLLSRAYFLAQRHVLPTSEEAITASLADLWAAGLFPPPEAGQPEAAPPGQ